MATLRLALIVGGLAFAGCHSPPTCASSGPLPGPLANAVLLRLTIYPTTATCEGNQVKTNGSAPLYTADYAVAAAMPIALASGTVVVHFEVYNDAEGGTPPVAEGCSVATINEGDTTCLNLSVSMDGGLPADLAPVPPADASPPADL